MDCNGPPHGIAFSFSPSVTEFLFEKRGKNTIFLNISNSIVIFFFLLFIALIL